MINWKVRFKNPIFWIQIISVTVLTLISGVGQSWENMTSWPLLYDTLIAAIMNPVTVVAVLVAWWTAATDPTVKGMGDSLTVLTRDEPLDIVTTAAKHAKEE